MKKLFFPLLLLSIVVAGCSLNTEPKRMLQIPPEANPSEQVKPEPSPVAKPITQITLYQVILDGSETGWTWDKTIIGCNDQLVAKSVSVNISEENKYKEIWDAVRSFDFENEGLHNPRKLKSEIEFYSYEINGTTLTINLTGNLMIGWVCEVPRLEESLKATYKALGYSEVNIIVNGKKFSEFAQ